MRPACNYPILYCPLENHYYIDEDKFCSAELILELLRAIMENVGRIRNLALIIGAMKCGTTSLFQYLSGHPQIAPCAKKEPNFFACPREWGLGNGQYESYFDFDPSAHKYALEASTDYAKLPYVDYIFDRLKKFSRYRYKFIYLIRNPIHRIQSHLRHAENTKSEILSLDAKRKTFSLDTGISQAAIDFCRYADHIEAYKQHFGDESLLVLGFEDFVERPVETVRQVCRFLRVSEDYAPKVEIHANPQLRDAPRKAWKFASSVVPLRNVVRFLVPEKVRIRLYSAYGSLKAPGRFELNASESMEILSTLKDDLRRLQHQHGFDVRGRWRIDPDRL